jgi:methylated-DNA-[protein]-cysteine S-methyltransferase
VVIAISAKPGIRVQAVTKAGSLQRVSLFSSKSFSFDSEFCEPALIDSVVSWLKGYANGQPFPFPDLIKSLPSSFRKEVLNFLMTIPWGRVVSYQDVAKGAGSPRAARAVGNICRGNPFPLLIPCHRVIRADGGIGCYTPDPSFKRKLLHFEEVAAAASS